MTQEFFWTHIGPYFFLIAGIFMLYAAYKYTDEEHEKMDWENQNWAGATSKEVVHQLPHWVLKIIYGIVGLFLIGVWFYMIFLM
ncbi:hypothetical protein [Pseudalkalibacillus sp. SCS-8]|uniref:hypothetical protein n=1 Tax=Pseudalkalibacillus nanhaiensis TaxID=3115291 RepID=UPI0032DA4F75